MKLVEDTCLLPESEQNHTLSFFLPITVKLRIISLMVSLPQKEKLLVSVDAIVGVELLATTLADKHMANGLPNYMLFMNWQ